MTKFFIAILAFALCSCATFYTPVPQDIADKHEKCYLLEDEVINRLSNWIDVIEPIPEDAKLWVEPKLIEIDEYLAKFYKWAINVDEDVARATNVRKRMWLDIRYFLLIGDDSYLENPNLSADDRVKVLQYLEDIRTLSTQTRKWINQRGIE